MRQSSGSTARPPWVVPKGTEGGDQQEEWKETHPRECGERGPKEEGKGNRGGRG